MQKLERKEQKLEIRKKRNSAESREDAPQKVRAGQPKIHRLEIKEGTEVRNKE